MDFVIVGAGCAGLVLAAQLRRRSPGTKFTILERASSLGGTWYHNTYPGCAVDMPCVTYSMSFDPALTYRQWFPSQHEILQYLHHIASKYDINSRLRLNAEMLNATWDEETKLWTVKYRDSKSYEISELRSKILVSAIGQLVVPSYGGIKGMDRFKGDVLHCNRWSADIALDGKDVVVIGNGASGTQVVPSIVNRVRSLTQLIRSPQGYDERRNPTLSSLTVWMFNNIPLYLRAWRYWNFLTLESRFSQFQDTPQGEKIRQKNMQLCHQNTKATAPKKYWDLLLPDYEAGCKRVIGDFGYLASLNAPNLDLLCDPVERCEDTGVLTKSGRRYKADAIIFATGYESQWHHLDVRGREGVSLTDKWSQETTSHYQTTAVSGFPNFFMLYGPNSAPPNMSAIYCFENYVDLILELVEPIQKGQFSSVEPDPRAEKAFMAELLGALDKGVWESCKKRTSDPKRNVNMYPWSNMTMFRNTHSRDSKAWVYDVDQGKPT